MLIKKLQQKDAYVFQLLDWYSVAQWLIICEIPCFKKWLCNPPKKCIHLTCNMYNWVQMKLLNACEPSTFNPESIISRKLHDNWHAHYAQVQQEALQALLIKQRCWKEAFYPCPSSIPILHLFHSWGWASIIRIQEILVLEKLRCVALKSNKSYQRECLSYTRMCLQNRVKYGNGEMLSE